MSISKDEYASIVSSFLKNVDFELVPWEFPPGAKEQVIDHFSNKSWSEKHKDFAVKVAKSLFSSIIFYPYSSRDFGVLNGILSTYCALLDDSSEYLGTSVDNFTLNILNGKPQEHPFLQSFVEFLSNDLKCMNPFIHSMIVQDCMCFMAGSVIERDHPKDIVPRDAINFARYLREKNGLGELYAYWAFSEYPPEREQRQRFMPVIQDLRNFIGQGNDVLSFYKEWLDGEEDMTYIGNVMKAQGLSSPDALRFVCSEAAQSIKNIRMMLSKPGQQDVLDIANGFINGYLSWHLHLGRYRLDELPLIDKENNLMTLAIAEPKTNNKTARQFVFGKE